MQRALGQDWQLRYQIASEKNQWGVEQPRSQDLDRAPQVIRMFDFRCRREAHLNDEPTRD